jgi:MFS family permease
MIQLLKKYLHIGGGIAFIGAYITADSESWRLVHTYFGYGFGIIFLIRILIGLIPKTSLSLRMILARALLIKRIFQHIKKFEFAQIVKWQIWYGSTMGILVVLMYSLSIPLVLFGIGAYEEVGGKWLVKLYENGHEFIGELYLFIIFTHLGIVILKNLLVKKSVKYG